MTINLDNTEFSIDEKLRPSTLRKLNLKPELDAKIDALPVRNIRFSACFSVHLLRLYRRIRPRAVGDRCVFEPSCSRYSEMAFRQHKLPKAIKLTRHRLKKCRPGNGGIDLTEVEIKDGI